MIEPTVGRVVWYHPTKDDPGARQVGEQPHAAHVAHVWNDRCVNLMVIDSNGVPYNRTSVTLVQDGDPVNALGGYCEWMPYQKGQAAKAVATEADAKIAAAVAREKTAEEAEAAEGEKS